MRTIVRIILLFTVMTGAIVPFCLQSHYYSLASPLKKFSSYEEMKVFVKARLRDRYSYSPTFLLSARSGTESYTKSTVPDYSATNIQVEGVDEADIVKTDGKYIYFISSQNVIILRAYPPEEAEILSQIRFNATIKGAFINGNKLAVFEQGSETLVRIYDVSDKENPTSKRVVSVNGSYFNSRMIGDYVYAVITQSIYYKGEISLPIICSNNYVETVDASEIYYSDIPDYSYGFTTIVSVNMQNDEEEPTYKTFLLGQTSEMYVSLHNIYITFPQNGNTLIYRFHIEGSAIESAANGGVQGHILNQFSMDEHNGYFRIATTTGQIARTFEAATSLNHVYVLDMDMNLVGGLEGLAPGEKIYSARFMGDRCYLVTFQKIDPLFVIDLEDPFYPNVLGELKITGYSDYLHPYDENHIIGIGKETIEAETGDFAWFQGVKISLFDVSNVENPMEISKYEIGDRGTDSPVLRDHKAFLFDKTRSLLVIPVLVAEINEENYPNGVPPNRSGSYVWQGAYVFNVTSEQGLMFRGGITHLEDDNYLLSHYYSQSHYSIQRSLYIENVLYTISNRKIKLNLLSDLSLVNEIELP
ncbi:MAG: beta-propeller domain-containing protein [Candidatus Bathyarchaeota archaeon]|nr:beta-propeller domain-containing protein [Candidatus Bathyarchaeota archaeon]MDH5732658.1 beta-propeller domain-containing protein [Candidatus Bathyarchaeota archaeon]